MSARGPHVESAFVAVTGFGAFEDVRLNASGLVAERLTRSPIGGVPVRGAVLPTAYDEARAAITRLAREPACVGVVALGVWRGSDVRLERRAHGTVTSARADIRGQVWAGRSLGEDFATSVDAPGWARDLGMRLSDDCGGYVCNAAYHALLAAAAGDGQRAGKPAVFLHVPRDVAERALLACEAKVRTVLTRLVAIRSAA